MKINTYLLCKMWMQVNGTKNLMNINSLALLLLTTVMTTPQISAASFKSILGNLANHPKVKQIGYEKDSFLEQSIEAGSLPDPVLKIAIQNIPASSLQHDRTPMSGFEVTMSQSLPLNSRLTSLESAFLKMSEVAGYRRDFMVRKLKHEAWKHAISWKSSTEEIKLTAESKRWLKKQLKISNTLYANGKVSQRAILEIETKIADLEATEVALKREEVRVKEKLVYIIGIGSEDTISNVDPGSIRVDSLGTSKERINQPMIEALKSNWHAKAALAESAQLSKTPNLTVGFSYKKRSEIDDLGDFVGAFVALPLNFGQKASSNHRKALSDYQASKEALENLIWERTNTISSLERELVLLEREKHILKEKSLKFSTLNRRAVSKSYGIGAATYEELLSAEMSHLRTLIRISRVSQKIANHKIELRFAKGESLS